MITLKTKKIIQRATELKINDDGFTIVLSAAKKVIVAGQSFKTVPVGWKVKLPKGKYGRVTNWYLVNKNTLNSTLFVEEGYVPPDTEINLEVTLRNHGPYPITILPNQEIASMQILTKPPVINITVVEEFNEIPEGNEEENTKTID